MALDTLSDVLRGVRLRGAVFFNVSGSGDWAAEAPPAREIAPLLMPGAEHVIEYHAVAQGSCWAAIPGGPSVRLERGDAVLFPHGDGHVVSSSPGLRGRIDFDFLADAGPDPFPVRVAYRGQQVSHSRLLDGDAETMVVCGFLACDLQPFNPLIASLPRLLHLQADAGSAWITGFSQQAATESQARRPGSQAMLARMSEMMFVDAVRRHAEQMPAESSGWLAGLRDRFVGRALALLHEQPARDWSIDELGRQIGLSRSALHERFLALVGIAPMQYLAQWRMQAAARLLLETHATVAAVALDVGYESEAAFARAFKRQVGTPPAAWRRERQAMVSDSPRAAAQSERAPTTTAASNSARAGRDSGST